jgi:hypothetical protein
MGDSEWVLNYWFEAREDGGEEEAAAEREVI